MSSPHDTFPAALAPLLAHHQFIITRLTPDPERPGKTLKHPLTPWAIQMEGYVKPAYSRHDAHDPAVWLPYAQARDMVAALGGLSAPGNGYAVGFTFTAELGFWFVDIDGCLEPAGVWSQLSRDVCAMLPGAAVEVSQSGRGLHAFGRLPPGPRPEHSCKNVPLGIELYTGERFCVIGTGALGDAGAEVNIAPLIEKYFPPEVANESGDIEGWTTEPVPEWSGPSDDAELVRRARGSVSTAGAFGGRASFDDLWCAREAPLVATWPPNPNSDMPWDGSSADMALASHLAFWTGRNCARMMALMRESGLVREKWDKRAAYLEETVLVAAMRCTKVMGQDRKAQVAAMNLIAPAAVGAGAGLTFTAAAGGLIAATVANVEGVLLSAESGVHVAHDEFRSRLCIREGDKWRLMRDADYGHMRASLERRGFKPVSKEVMHTVVGMVSSRCAFDSAQDMVNALQWDGVPRVATAMSRYYGCEDTPYTRAAGAYLFTALPGRTLAPGCQADMAVILVGVQGARKTSAVSSLALHPDHFGSVNLSQQDAELAKKLRGKTIVEWAELRGLTTRDQDSIKDWITNRKEEFRDAYAIFPEPYLRRCLVVGTANGDEILDDPTGERRWLPMHAGHADVEALQRDIAQLWAEGAAMWRAGGIRWQEAERLAKDEHHKFKVYDEWQGAVERWLTSFPLPGMAQVGTSLTEPNGAAPFTMIRMLSEALGVTPDRAGMKEQHRAGKLLKSMGYRKTVMRDGKIMGKVWTRVTT